MPLSADIERDLAALDDKMKKKAHLAKMRHRLLIGAAAIWVMIMVLVGAYQIFPEAAANVIAAVVGPPMGAIGLGFLIWGMITAMDYDLKYN